VFFATAQNGLVSASDAHQSAVVTQN